MCFSATGSIIASGLLLPTGIYCLKRAHELGDRYLILATIPLLFGIQQLCEGILWINIGTGNTQIIKYISEFYLIFSHLLWLIITPLAILLIETDRKKIFICTICLIAGMALSVDYLPILLNTDFHKIYIQGNSIVYKVTLNIQNKELSFMFEKLPYPIIILTPLLISSIRQIRITGVLMTISMLISFLFFEYAFTSVWCFFAAIISIYIALIFSRTSTLKTLTNKKP
jgi:hypothetical protein